MAGERLGGGDPPTRLVGDELGPLAGRVDRRSHHPEVLGIEVGDHDEPVAPVVDGVLDVVDPLPHDHGRRRRLGGRDQPGLAAELALALDDDPLAAAAQPDADEEPLVEVLVHEHVVVLGGAEDVAPHLERAHLLVGLDVHQRRAVGGPGDAAPRGVVQLVGQVGAAVQIADAHRVALAAVAVRAPRQQVVIRADLERGHREVLAVRAPRRSRRAPPARSPLPRSDRGSGSGSSSPLRCGPRTTTRPCAPAPTGRSPARASAVRRTARRPRRIDRRTTRRRKLFSDSR